MISCAIWAGILFCISQSAMFSGLNLAFFSITRLRLEIEVTHNNKAAHKVLAMRRDSNFLLSTILWGNVGINVLLTLLSNSVMAGMIAFLFSTIVITFFGEILPQSYFSRHALKMASNLSPVLRLYQILLYPLAKPTAKFLDTWLGDESIQYFKEKSLKELIRKHMEGSEEIDYVEGIGAINFLSIDDLMIGEEGVPIDPESIIQLPLNAEGKVQFPAITKSLNDPFLQQLHLSEHKWVIVTDGQSVPRLVIDADGFLRSALFDDTPFNPCRFTHRPVIITDSSYPLGEAIRKLENSDAPEDDVIDNDIILLWGEKKQIITGSDILGRLLRGIARQTSPGR